MNNLNVYRHFYIHGKKIIETDQGKFFIVPRCSDKEKTFHYLESKKFPFFFLWKNRIGILMRFIDM